jgi:hypothetical protein
MKRLSRFCRIPQGIDWRVLVPGAIFSAIQGILLSTVPYEDSRFIPLVIVRSILALIFVTVLAYALERR